MKLELEPSKSVVWRSQARIKYTGRPQVRSIAYGQKMQEMLTGEVCEHPKIPGIGVDFCPECRIYWVDLVELLR